MALTGQSSGGFHGFARHCTYRRAQLHKQFFLFASKYKQTVMFFYHLCGLYSSFITWTKRMSLCKWDLLHRFCRSNGPDLTNSLIKADAWSLSSFGSGVKQEPKSIEMSSAPVLLLKQWHSQHKWGHTDIPAELSVEQLITFQDAGEAWRAHRRRRANSRLYYWTSCTSAARWAEKLRFFFWTGCKWFTSSSCWKQTGAGWWLRLI